MASAPIPMRVNNVDLRVSMIGRGTPLVWGHGLMSSMASEDLAPFFQWERLADVATVIRYDARGHGQSGASADRTTTAGPEAVKEMGARLAEYDAATLANVLRGAKLTDFPPREQIQSITAQSLILA